VYRLAVQFSGYAGTRPHETVELRKRDVINGERLLVSRAAKKGRRLAQHDGSRLYRIGDTETHSSRQIWVPGDLLDEIKAHVVNRAGADSWDAVAENALLFSEDGATHINHDRLTKVWRKAVIRTLPDRLHRQHIDEYLASLKVDDSAVQVTESTSVSETVG
jgi:integrase